MSPAAVPPPPPARAPIGSAATVRTRLASQRQRPALVRLYAALFADAGLLGAPARRRLRGALLRAIPALVTAAGAAALVLGRFEATPLAPAELAGLVALVLTTSVVAGRMVWRKSRGERVGHREGLELGGLLVVGAVALVQATGGGAAEPPLQPLVYLLMACLVAFLDLRVGTALVLLAVGLEGGRWLERGADPLQLASPLAHAAFIALFAFLYRFVLFALMKVNRSTEEAAVRRRLREIDEKAGELRLLAPRAGEGRGEADPGQRWIEGAVREVEAAVRGAVEVASRALRSQTCAVYLLTPDDQRLVRRECRSDSDAIAAELPSGEGALGAVVKRQTPIRLHGEVKAASYHADGRRPGALLAVPLVDRRGGHLRGVLVADRADPQPFSDEDERLLVIQANEILRTISAERLVEDLKKARDEKAGFFEAIEWLNRTTTVEEVAEASLEVAKRMVAGSAFAAVTLVEQGDGKRSHRVACSWPPSDKGPALKGLTFGDEPRSLVSSVVGLGSSLPMPGVAIAQVFDAGTRLRGLGIESLKVVPLKAQPLKADDASVLGTLVLGSRYPDAFDSDLVHQLEVIAKQAAESIKRARLFDATERLATTDGLTGLLNHRTFQGRLDEQLHSALRYGRKLSLILCDIDHFKSVNDTYGHPVGDQVLRGVARVLAKEARATDVVARYGGEEFAVVMPETDAAGAMVIAERIRERVGQLVTGTPQGPLKVTLSLGIATCPDAGTRKAELVERADACLYQAKRGGRNRSVSAATQEGPRPLKAC